MCSNPVGFQNGQYLVGTQSSPYTTEVMQTITGTVVLVLGMADRCDYDKLENAGDKHKDVAGGGYCYGVESSDIADCLYGGFDVNLRNQRILAGSCAHIGCLCTRLRHYPFHLRQIYATTCSQPQDSELGLHLCSSNWMWFWTILYEERHMKHLDKISRHHTNQHAKHLVLDAEQILWSKDYSEYSPCQEQRVNVATQNFYGIRSYDHFPEGSMHS